MIIACGIARCRTRRHRWSSRIVSPGAGHGVTDGRRVSYRPSPDTASGMVVACRIVRRRIACRMACRRIASRHVLAVFTVRHPAGPSSAMPRPNSAGSRRRYRRFTNIDSFTCLSRSIMVPSAARLRRTVGRSRIPIHRAAQSGQPDNRTEHP
jgi:hypothetical protein